MTQNQLNAWLLATAWFRRNWDAGAAWVGGPRLGALLGPNRGGALILRRWSGPKYPRPPFTPAVGFALGSATEVTIAAGVAATPNIVYWIGVDKMDGVGLMTEEHGRLAEAMVFDEEGAHIGPMPNPPIGLQIRQGADGKLWLHWAYNPTRAQAAAVVFHVYSDLGTGTVQPTPVASIAAQPGMGRYVWRYDLDDWDGWLFTIVAESEAGVQSLAPQPHGAGCSLIHGFDAGPARHVALRVGAPPATPQRVGHAEAEP